MTEQELSDILNSFNKVIANADLLDSKRKKINFFSATKMLTLETKHSAFLSWLFDPQNEHCLNNSFLKKLLSRLYLYSAKADKNTTTPFSNANILKGDKDRSKILITSEQQLCDLADAKQINIYTEKSTYNGNRIDILIDIVDNETVIVIENKIDSSTHDDQLREYQNYVNSEYASYKKKIFIYLTKFGELPYDTDAKGKRRSYNGEWCTIDYGEIRCIIEELINELKNNTKTKTYNIDSDEEKTLIIIMEHYRNMVDTSILHTSPVAREKCKKLLSDPKIQEALEIIAAYQKIPTPVQIADYVCEQLGGEREGNSKYWFYTKPMKEYFINRNEEFNIGKMRCVCQPSDSKKDESKIIIWVECTDEKNKPKGLTTAQKELLQRCNITEIKSYNRLLAGQSFELVLETERGMSFDDLKVKLNPRIDAFKVKLDEFLKTYLN